MLAQLSKKSRRAFSLTDLVTAIAVVSLLAMMQIPFISRARESANRNACSNNMRQLAIGLLNYHDTYRRLPAVAMQFEKKTALLKMKAAQAEGDSATQYSFIVRITPYIEEGNLFNEISRTSKKFTLPAFDDQIKVQQFRPWDIAIATFVCPSFTGQHHATAKEYADRGVSDPVTGKRVQAAITNYVALPATHIDLLAAEEKANGAIIPSGSPPSMSSIRDGLSNTLFFAESREQDYSSWYDGVSTWVAGLPSSAESPKLDAGKWTLADNTPNPISFGPTKADAKRVYLDQKHWANQGPRSFGPSSEHAGEVVIHAYGDGAVRPIGTDVDPPVYLALITRAGNEPISDAAKAKLGMVDPRTPRPTAKPGEFKKAPEFEKRTD